MARLPLCRINDCFNTHYGRGFCVFHYKRWWTYGDPLGGGTPRHAVRRWIEDVAVPFNGTDCLIFPFYRARDGYGRMSVGGVSTTANARVLELHRGPKPSPKHEACHSCGKGHEGCVNPTHLYWGTRLENVADAKALGRLRGGRPKGYYHPGFKLKRESRSEIYEMLDTGVMQKDVAKHFRISKAYVSRLNRLRLPGRLIPR